MASSRICSVWPRELAELALDEPLGKTIVAQYGDQEAVISEADRALGSAVP